jgi:SAM-dependent methyltransferase
LGDREARENPQRPLCQPVGRKYMHFDNTEGSTHNLVVGLVPPGTRVLEFGCATGYMSRVLVERLGCSVFGVEVDAEAAEEAAAHCDRVLVGDAEEFDLEAELGGNRFDVILFADVLEHLRDPAALLQRVRPLLAEGGAVIASIPNVAHASVRLALLSGSFRYRETGLLDAGHLRFFTREGIQDLFERSGYVVAEWLRRRLEIEESEIPVPSHTPAEARAWASVDPEATTYQFVVLSVPADAARALAEARRELADLRQALEENRAVASDLREELERATVEGDARLEKLDAFRRAHEVLSRRLIAERAAFADGIARVQANVYASRSWRYTAPLRAVVGRLHRFKP